MVNDKTDPITLDHRDVRAGGCPVAIVVVDQLEYTAPEILFTLSIPSLYPTCALTNSDFWCHVFQVIYGEKRICSSWAHKMMCVVVYDTPSAVCCYTALNQANHMLREYLYTVLK